MAGHVGCNASLGGDTTSHGFGAEGVRELAAPRVWRAPRGRRLALGAAPGAPPDAGRDTGPGGAPARGARGPARRLVLAERGRREARCPDAEPPPSRRALLGCVAPPNAARSAAGRPSATQSAGVSASGRARLARSTRQQQRNVGRPRTGGKRREGTRRGLTARVGPRVQSAARGRLLGRADRPARRPGRAWPRATTAGVRWGSVARGPGISRGVTPQHVPARRRSICPPNAQVQLRREVMMPRRSRGVP